MMTYWASWRGALLKHTGNFTFTFTFTAYNFVNTLFRMGFR